MTSRLVMTIVIVSTTAAAGDRISSADTQVFEITRNSIDNGGVLRSTGGDLELSGTIGQHDTGTLAGGDLELSGGFWFPLEPADCNDDGLVNLVDHASFSLCLSGPDAPGSSECECADVDRSGTVDLRDFAAAQVAHTGP